MKNITGENHFCIKHRKLFISSSDLSNCEKVHSKDRNSFAKAFTTPVVPTDMEDFTLERSLMLLSIVKNLSLTLVVIAEMTCVTLVSSLVFGSIWSLP